MLIVARRYMAIFRSLEEKRASKEKETTARIQLQVVVANIDLLTEIKDGGLVVDEELDRLKELEKDCGAFVDSYPAMNWTISDLHVANNEMKSALEQVSFLESQIESSALKHADDLRSTTYEATTYEAKKALANGYLDVLISLKEK